MNKALILAAGMGSRLKKAHDLPKPLTDLNGEPSIFRLLRQFEESGITETAIVVGFRGEEIRSYTAQHYKGNIKLTWFENHKYKEPNGVSVIAAEEFITERVLLSMADHLFIGSPVKQMSKLNPSEKETVLLVDRDLDSIFDMDDATKVLTDSDGKILDIAKNISKYNAVDTGLFCISPELVISLKSLESPTLSEGVKLLGEKGLMTTLEIANGTWQDIDTPETLEYARKILSEKDL
jgi:choline kinase